MNGVLTALLGGASGTGQGLQYQDEKRFKQLQLAVDMARNGQTPASQLLEGWSFPKDAADDSQPSTPGPSPVLPPSPTAPALARPGAPALPAWSNTGQPAAGAMSGTAAIRSAASAPQFTSRDVPGLGPSGYGGTESVGGIPTDYSKSQAFRGAVVGAYVENLKKNQDYQLELRKRADMAAGIRAAHPEMTAEQANELAMSPGAMSSVADPYNPNSPTGRQAKLSDEAKLAQITSDVGFKDFLRRQPGEIQTALAKALNENRITTATQVGIQSMLHNWEVEKEGRSQTFQREQKQSELAGSFANRIGEEKYKEGGEVMPRIVHGLFGGGGTPPNPTAPPSVTPNDRPTQQQLDWDHAAAALTMQKKNPTAVLGARP